ncbi:hypothetical protein BU15DRAFT_59474 [Melanogaster broomeanus]|nr:hypothetical protein BU15DRAFT_59474 [Melanogaster broomeanus]
MPPGSPSRLTGLKDYLSQREFRLSLTSRRALRPGEEGYVPGRTTPQSWSQWAGQKIRRNTGDESTVDEVNLFPGAFDVSLHVSGFATSRQTPELVTRSQRAFLRLARGFASLPKLQPTPGTSDTEIEDLPEPLRLPPTPDQISDDYEVQNLDKHFQNSTGKGENNELDSEEFPFFESAQVSPKIAPADRCIPPDLQRLHANLESRLKPFWASALSSRMVEVSVFVHSPHPQTHPQLLHRQPLLKRQMLTGPDGFFSGTFRIHWTDICTHPIGVHIAFDDTCLEHELSVEARVVTAAHLPGLHETPTNIMRIPITNSALRVISDIDDTVKVSRVPDGARAIFHNVFVKDLGETVIPEMGEWYDKMWKRGVRFHYVSNSPFELLPVLNRFLSISRLPPGSIRLRSYAGRSLFNGLLSAPATRKRANVVEVLDHFPHSRFLLVGDSGEQDLELYASLARDRPTQIAGVFIRDVSAVGLDDPTGEFSVTNNKQQKGPLLKDNVPFPSTGSLPSRPVPILHSGSMRIPRPTPKRSLPPTSYSFETIAEPKSPGSSSSTPWGLRHPRVRRRRGQRGRLRKEEKKRWDLQNRVNKARLQMPAHIVLRVFEDPRECLEADHIIEPLSKPSYC